MPVRYSQPLGYCSCSGARVCWGWERSPLSKGMQMSRVHLTSFHDPCRPQPPQPAGAVCHILDRAVALPLALERGNGSVQSFTSPALRLTESIKEDRPPRSPCAHPFSFLSALSICPNYFCLGCQRRFLAKGDRAEINSEHVGSSLFSKLVRSYKLEYYSFNLCTSIHLFCFLKKNSLRGKLGWFFFFLFFFLHLCALAMSRKRIVYFSSNVIFF